MIYNLHKLAVLSNVRCDPYCDQVSPGGTPREKQIWDTFKYVCVCIEHYFENLIIQVHFIIRAFTLRRYGKLRFQKLFDELSYLTLNLCFSLFN